MSSQTPPAFRSPYAPPGTPPDIRHQIHYATDGVQPPSAVYLDVNDKLVVQLITIDPFITLNIRYRILLPDGEILFGQHDVISADATGQPQDFSFALTEGFLLTIEIGGDVAPGGSPILARGLTRVRGFIARSPLNKTFILFQGMLDAQTAPGWPNFQNEPGCNGQGSVRSITGTVPAAGAEITEVTPSKRRWLPKSFRFQLTTSATVATRGVAFVIDDGTNILYAVEAPSTQAASLVQQYNVALISNRLDKVFGTNITLPMPMLQLMMSGYRLRTLTTALQAGDQYTAPQYEVEEWFTNP